MKPDDAVCYSFGKNSLALPCKLRVERGIADTGRGHGHFTHGSPDLLPHLAVTTVATHAPVIGKMCVRPAFKGRIKILSGKGAKAPSLSQQMKNKYIKSTHISERKTRAIIRCFSLDIEAKKMAKFTGVSRQTANKFYALFRERIYGPCEAESPFENGEMELDESYFGARRVRGKRGRGVLGKTPVFGMPKRGDKVYTQIVRHCSIKGLLPIIRGSADSGSVIYNDGYKVYDEFVNYGLRSITECNIRRMSSRTDITTSFILSLC